MLEDRFPGKVTIEIRQIAALGLIAGVDVRRLAAKLRLQRPRRSVAGG